MRHRIGVGLAALLAAVSAPAAECFWTGAQDGTSLHDPANWADGRGAPLAACPGTDDDVVFTNTAPLALTPAKTVKFHGMRFLGSANVEVTKKPSQENILCSGGVTNDSRAQVKFSYVSRFKGDYVDSFVGEGAKTSFDISVYPDPQTVIGKSGPGEMVLCASAGTNPGFPDNLKVRLCGGTLGLGRASRQIDGTHYGSAPRRGVRIEFFGACGAACVTFPVEDVVLSNDCALVETDVTGHAHSLQGPVGRTLTLAGTWQDTVFTGFIGGALVVRWMPSNDAVFTLSGSTSTGGGSLYVDGGVFRLADGAVYASPWHFRVAAGAQYRNETPHALCAPKGDISLFRSADRKPLYLAENAVLRGAAGNTFMLDGVQLAPGLYHRGNCDWIDGDGYVLVPGDAEPSGTATATWTGNGGAETSVLNPANWGAADNATLPDLTSGALEATFPVGARATVPEQTEVAFKKLVVSSASPFVLAGGAGARVRLGSGGLVLPKQAGGACTVETPLLLVADQTWALTNDLTLAAGARVAALSETTLTRIGTGSWVVDADHNHLATLVLTGPKEEVYGVRTFFRADGASGNEQTVVKVLSAAQIPTFGTGSVLAQVRPAFDACPNPFAAFPAGETVVAGACVLTDDGNLNAQNFRLEAGAQVRFLGGLSYMGANNNSAFSASSTATSGRIGVTVEEAPAEVTRLLLLTSSYTWNLPPSALDKPHPALDWRFRVGGNKFARGLIVGATNATLYTEAPNFMATPTNTKCAGNLVRGIRFVRAGTWDLCGVDQEVGGRPLLRARPRRRHERDGRRRAAGGQPDHDESRGQCRRGRLGSVPPDPRRDAGRGLDLVSRRRGARQDGRAHALFDGRVHLDGARGGDGGAARLHEGRGDAGVRRHDASARPGRRAVHVVCGDDGRDVAGGAAGARLRRRAGAAPRQGVLAGDGGRARRDGRDRAAGGRGAARGRPDARRRAQALRRLRPGTRGRPSRGRRPADRGDAGNASPCPMRCL